MADPFIGEIKIFSFGYPPKGWALCNGQQLPIAQNQALFSLLGTTYGGNGQTTFALPDLRGRVPVHRGSAVVQGQLGGEEAHTLIATEMPLHTHLVQAAVAAGDSVTPAGNLLAASPAQLYAEPVQTTTLTPSSVGAAGGSQPHPNLAPYLTVSHCIALQGVFPSRD